MNVRRHRKALAALVLGTWLFAFFVGVANACNALPSGGMQDAGMAMGASHDGDEDGPSSCLQFCNDDTPVVGKVQVDQDQPAGQPLLVAPLAVDCAPSPVLAGPAGPLAHPPPDVPLLLRTLRLAL
jgi:hypothetical protein